MADKVAADGFTETATVGDSVTVMVADFVVSATLVAFTAAVWTEAILAGAV